MLRDLPGDQLAAFLDMFGTEQPEATEHLLVAAGSEARLSDAMSDWLATEKMMKYVLGLVDRAANEKDSSSRLSTLRVLAGAGFNMSNAGVSVKIIEMVRSILPKDELTAATAEQIEKVCNLIDVVQTKEQWQEQVAIQLLFDLFSLDNGQWGTELQGKLERTWLKGVRGGEGVEDHVNVLTKQQLMTGIPVQERSVAKCVLILKQLKQEEQDTYILAFMPALTELKPLSLEASYLTVLTQDQFHTVSPLPDTFTQDSGLPDLSRPHAAVFLTRLLLHKLGLSSPSLEEETCSTVMDSERRGLGVQFVPHLAELVLCLSYISSLSSRSDCPESVSSLWSVLSSTATVLVSHLDSSTCSKLQHLIRGNSLNQGGLWSRGLAWLVRLQYWTSEWEVKLTSMLPRVDTWTDGELATGATVIGLSSELGTGGGMISQTLTVEAARLISLGGLGGFSQSPGLVWMVSRCLKLATVAQVSELTLEVSSVLDCLPAWRAEHEARLLYSRDLSTAAWDDVSTVTAVSSLLAVAVDRSPAALSPALWDLASCSLVSWAASLEETGEMLLQQPGSALFTVGVARLAASLGRVLGPRGHHPALSPPPAGLEEEEETLPPRLREEWAEFFSEGVFSALLRVYEKLKG